jgi:uncharacterized protein
MKQTLITITMLLLFVSAAFGQIPTRIENTRVQDHANLLTAEQRSALDQKLKNFNETKFTDLGVILVPTINGADPDNYTTEVGKTFGIGPAEGEHRGIVFLLAINDRRCHIQGSRHIQYVYSSGRMGQLCRDLRPQLRAQDYNGAVNKGVDELIAMSAALDQVQATGVRSDQQDAKILEKGGGGVAGTVLGVLLVFGLMVGGTFWFLRRRRIAREEAIAEAERQARQERLAAERAAREKLEKIRLEEEEKKRKAHERWLKTPEGIADTKRKAEEARLEAERQRKLAAEREAKAREERRLYAIWAASPAGKAELARKAEQERQDAERRRKQRKQEEERERQRRKKAEEEEEERRRRRRRDDSSSSSSSYGGFSSSYSSNSSSSSSSSGGGFGGSSDFGGGGGGDSW